MIVALSPASTAEGEGSGSCLSVAGVPMSLLGCRDKLLSRAACPLLLAAWFTCGAVDDLGAQPEEEPTAVFTRVKAMIAANQSAAKSVTLKGRSSVDGRVVKQGSGKAEREPFQRRGTFRFIADEYGKLKRWDVDWHVAENKGLAEHRALNENVVLDASAKGARYVRPVSQFLISNGDNLDFYRDHWFGEAISELTKPTNPGKWTAKRQEDRIVLEYVTAAYGKPMTYTVEINPRQGHLVNRVERLGGVTEQRCRWSQEPLTQLWYQKEVVGRYRMTFPSGMVWEELIRLEVDEARFNVPVESRLFTFEGLDLEPDSIVWDQRVSPAVEYVFMPKDGVGGGLLSSLMPAAAVAAEEERKAFWETWKYRLLLLGGMLVFGVIAATLYLRLAKKRRDEKGV